MPISITLACGAYDRTLPLADGRVRAEGAELNCILLPVEEIFFRTARNAEFDVAEMSLSSYTLTLERDSRFMAIPVFPSRAFRHNGVYVNANSGITGPADLIGRTIGVPEYQVTAAVWIRGILAEHHGVPVDSVRYRTGGLHAPGRPEKLAIEVPGVDIQPIHAGQTLAQMLVAGEIDALYTPRTPAPYLARDPAVRRLFPDPRAAEEEYFRRTGIFPIMHTVIIRRDVYEAHRWLAGSLFKAFAAAKALAMGNVEETAALTSILPWSYADAEATRHLMGADFWPYGIDANGPVLRTFLGYLHDQHLVSRLLEPAELFAPETHASFVI